ncbi:hypothetical protein P8452_21175 [Trifolium repens]|nr:hypothetical protein P8452_21175 [Trifolium repens]
MLTIKELCTFDKRASPKLREHGYASMELLKHRCLIQYPARKSETCSIGHIDSINRGGRQSKTYDMTVAKLQW